MEGFKNLQQSEDVTSLEAQARFAEEYLAAYAEYSKISEKRSNDLRILDKLREEAISPDLIAKQEDLFASSRGAENEAMAKYLSIGKKLTKETKDKYLSIPKRP